MEKRKVREFSPKTYRVLIGIMIILVSISLCLNTGYISKIVSFPFAYSLGMISYLFYGFLFVEGMFLIIRGRCFGIKMSRYFWFAIILAFGLAGLLTYFAAPQETAYFSFVSGEGQANVFSKLNSVFNNVNFGENVGKYLSKDFVLVFFGDNEFGCGLLGYIILTLGNSIFSSAVGGLVLSICLVAIGFGLIVVPAVITIVKNTKRVKKEKAEKPQQIEINSHKRIKNINVIKGARNIDPNNYHTEVSGAGRNLENYKEEMLKDPIDDIPAIPFSSTAFSEESFEDHMKEVDPAIESLDEFREAVLDVGESDNAPITRKATVEEKYGPIEDFSSVEPEEDPFGDDIFSDKTALDNFLNNTKKEPTNETVQSSFDNVFASKPVSEPSTPVINNVQPTRPVQPIVEQPKPVQPVQSETQKPKKQRVNFTVLNSGLLDVYETREAAELNARVALERKEIINNTFKDFGVGAEVVDYTIGPSVTRFNIRYNSNVSVRSVSNMVQDISIRLNGVGARFESVIEGQSTSGLEIPNEEITTVAFKDVYEALPDTKKHPLAIAFGKNIKGSVIYADFDEFPHMLVSGTTGSGKSVFVNSIICTLIMRNSPDDLKLVLVDPKKVEMSRYADMPHLLTPIITEPTKVKLVLDKLVDEMEYRYSIFSKNNATNIKEYNEDCEYNGNERIPYIVVVLDEYADLVEQCKDISCPVVMLAQKARACGIHVMLSTQRPSTNVVTGVIKANMPTHVALMTANYVDSTTIIGEGGAEKLLGKGDMLVQSPLVSRVGVCRLQSCFINRHEISRIVGELKSKYPTDFDPDFMNLEEQKPSEFAPADIPEGNEGNDEESKYRYIKDWVMTQEYMSMSKIQRDCSVGFNRAGRFFNRLQQEGIVALESEGSKGCKVILQNKFGDIDDDDVIPTSEDNSYIKR